MSDPGSLPVRLRQYGREIAKFGAVGGLGLLVNIAAFNLLRHVTEMPVVRASVLATVVAIFFNYVGFRYFTYRDRDKGGRTKELTLFLLFSAVGLVIENGVLYAATYGFGWDSPWQSNFFKLFGTGVATLFRFWSYRTWVFRTMPAREAVQDAESFLDVEQRTGPGKEPGQEPERESGPGTGSGSGSSGRTERVGQGR